MKIPRRFTTPDQDVYSTVDWVNRSSKITNADGSVVFEMNQVEVPKQWSQLATDIMVSKYFRKAGVPQFEEDGTPVVDEQGEPVTGPESSVRQVVHRLAGCWQAWGETHHYFDGVEDAKAFYDELVYMMLHQMAAPNSPQWFNTGLHWAYGISGPPQGHWVCHPDTGESSTATDAYSHPQPHACFIQSVNDDLVNEGGIMDLWTREARLFKYGSGTGTNFSSLRGENEALSGGGRSSGLMSFLKIGDRAAGAIKSGGTTRRAAKMVCLDADHPDIESFVNWKVREELKVASMVEGLKHLSPEQRETAERLNLDLDYDFNGEAYASVSGQNSNNSVRLTNSFFQVLEADGYWHLSRRTDGEVAKSIKAKDLWDQITYAAWQCADPGLQYDTTINEWHTCTSSGRINASNPCSEYMFIDNTACNLASINVLTFFDSDSRIFDVDGFEHAINIWTIVLEISVLMASFPSRIIAEQSYNYRTLGLGFANLGAMLMQAGIPYDSEEGRAIAAAITAILTGRSYARSAEMARELSAFPGYAENSENMLRVIRNHRRAAYGVPRDSDAYEGLHIKPLPINHELFEYGKMSITNGQSLLHHATIAWDEALSLGEQHGYRNAQVTVIAPTGTIGLLMDCDTTGVEPDFSLVKFKKLAGGGYFKIANASLRPALKMLGYSQDERDDILRYVMGDLSLDVELPERLAEQATTFREYLLERGYSSEELVQVENQLPQVFELNQAFTAWNIPETVLTEIGLDVDEVRANPAFSGLRELGFNDQEIERLNREICGTQCIEGAPHIKDEHLPVFDCANRCGEVGKRFIKPEGHIRMMTAVQPFLSGAISKTINLPRESTVDDIAQMYKMSWDLGLKATALYRDGCKLSQPLNTKVDDELDEEDVDQDEIEEALDEVAAEVIAAASSTSVTESDDAGDIQPPYIERVVERIVERPLRRRLPDTRESLTHHFNVAGHEGYLTVGMYKNGSPGELFITMSKEGSTIGGLMDSLGTAISVALQYGVPIESLVNKFAHQRFEPMGMTTNRDIPFAKSLVDYIFRWLGMEFVPGYREANAPQRSQSRSKSGGSSIVKEEKTWSDQDSDGGTPGANRLRSSTQPGSRDVVEEEKIAEESTLSTLSSTSPITKVSPKVSDQDQTDEGSAPGVAVATPLDQSNAQLMGDAPTCEQCGAITVRNGSCYRCHNCGNSMGCS